MISKYADELLHRKIRPQKTWFIENPISDFYFDVDWQFERGRIFCCSTIRPLKNALGMIKALAHIVRRFPHAHLHIAGSTPNAAYLRACKQEVESNNLHDSVRFLGNLTIKGVQFELSKANCLAIPSFQENAPLAIEEAMAVGVPVVGARVGGIAYMVEEGRTGYLIDPYNVKDIAEAVSKILADDALAISMSQRAKQIAKRRFMSADICKQILEAYNEILSEK
jgi:glycosyltransferase involved in cell wall biosynthesis